MGDRMAHLHLADGSGSALDEHLVPGRGRQPCALILEKLAAQRFAGSVVVEIGTRKVPPAVRELDLAEALSFARLNLASAV
jgi:sugar phosphate isomerase/epimerase